MTTIQRAFIVIAAFAAVFAFALSVYADKPADKADKPEKPQKEVCEHGNPNDTARCHAHVITDGKGNPEVTNHTAVGYGPVQFQTAYGAITPQSAVWSWNGKTVAIVDAYDLPTAEADLAAYSQTFHLPPCTTANGCFKKVNQNGSTNTRSVRSDKGWGLEIALDVQAVHAMCPNCKILLVEASSNSFGNLLAAEDYATAHADVISNSWGANEFSSETSVTYNGHFNRPGKVITVSSGDSGYGAEFPAASRYVTAVGGTTLTLNSDNTRATESAWSGSGSGCSSYETKPSWQTDIGCARRTIADVSADADPNTGAAVYDSYGYGGQSGWFQVGGTSLAAPLIAATYALGGHATSAQYLYAHASSLFDVVGGSNGSCAGTYLCTSLAGFDGPTGLGSPNGLLAF